jgi:hypothetical protein
LTALENKSVPFWLDVKKPDRAGVRIKAKSDNISLVMKKKEIFRY